MRELAGSLPTNQPAVCKVLRQRGYGNLLDSGDIDPVLICDLSNALRSKNYFFKQLRQVIVVFGRCG